MGEIAIEGVTAGDPLLRMKQTQIFSGKWEKRWMNRETPLKGKRIEAWIGWSGRQTRLLLQQSWNALYSRSFDCLSLSRSTGWKTFWITLTPSRRHWAFNSLQTRYYVVPSPPLSKELQESGSQSCQCRPSITSSIWAMPFCATS